jgi:DNA helicase-2/ATP-dependent DNA helicase PcrA
MTAKTPSSSHESSPKSESASAPQAPPNSIDNIARFFGGKSGFGKPGALARPVNRGAPGVEAQTHGESEPEREPPEAPRGAAGLKKGQRVRHSKYGEGTVLMREGDGEGAKLTVLFNRHGMKKLMEKFANLQKI